MKFKGIYLKELQVENFKSLKNSRIVLKEGLNLIIGKNGSGKSNLLEFIYKFATRNIFSPIKGSRYFNSTFNVSYEYLYDNRKIELSYFLLRIKKKEINLFLESSYAFEITLSKKTAGEKVLSNKVFQLDDKESRKSFLDDPETIDLFNFFRRLRKKYIKFGLPLNQAWISKPNRLTIDDENIVIEEAYSEVSFFQEFELELETSIDGLTKKIKKDPSQLRVRIIDFLNNYINNSLINQYLRDYTPIQEIRFNPNVNIYSTDQNIIVENLLIDFLVEDDWIPWSYLSDGTKRLFFLVSEVISPLPNIILVEEPELGIHPHQLTKILEFLQNESREKQVIISTHSPLVLDVLKEDELDRITIAKYENGTKFYKLGKQEINKAKKYINEVGELSYYWLHSDLEK